MPSVLPNRLLKFLPIAETVHLSPKLAYLPWQSQSHVRGLPARPTDIKGVDLALYPYIHRRTEIYKVLPFILKNEFFALKFIPASHHACLARKSNIAYTFFNQGLILNNKSLQKRFAEYKGQYRNNVFFSLSPNALGTAVARLQFRRKVKSSLFDAIRATVSGDDKVRGIFCFELRVKPVTKDDERKFDDEMSALVSRLCSSQQLRAQIEKTVAAVRKPTVRALKKDVARENTASANRVPGYCPKLPFYSDYG